jgi:hypothetical protein
LRNEESRKNYDKDLEQGMPFGWTVSSLFLPLLPEGPRLSARVREGPQGSAKVRKGPARSARVREDLQE